MTVFDYLDLKQLIEVIQTYIVFNWTIGVFC